MRENYSFYALKIFDALRGHDGRIDSSTTLDSIFFLTVTLPSCRILTSEKPANTYSLTDLVTKVRSLSHIAEQTNFHDTCEHFDFFQELR